MMGGRSNSTVGRWMTRDPLGEAGGINLYQMVGNNAVNFYDPYGLIDWGKVGLGTTVGISGLMNIAIGGGLTYAGYLEMGSGVGAFLAPKSFAMAAGFFGAGGYGLYHAYNLIGEGLNDNGNSDGNKSPCEK